jgi:hypothetical protein
MALLMRRCPQDESLHSPLEGERISHPLKEMAHQKIFIARSFYESREPMAILEVSAVNPARTVYFFSSSVSERRGCP